MHMPRLLLSVKPAFVLRRIIHTSVWWDMDNCRVPKGCDPYSIPDNIRDAIAKLSYQGPINFSAYGDKRRLHPNVKQALSDTGVEFTDIPYEDNCRVPKGCDPYSIPDNIRDAIAKLSYQGPVNFSAYGDKRRLHPNVKQALSDTGVEFTHVPDEVSISDWIRRDLREWVDKYSPPANCLIMCGDKDLAHILHSLGLETYNILLAKPRKVSGVLEAAAKTVWQWKRLRAGGLPEWTRSW